MRTTQIKQLSARRKHMQISAEPSLRVAVLERGIYSSRAFWNVQELVEAVLEVLTCKGWQGATSLYALSTQTGSPWMKAEMLRALGRLKFCLSQNLVSGKTTVWKMDNLKDNSKRKCISEDFQRCPDSRWLIEGYDHSRNKSSLMWPGSHLSVLCYFLVAIITLKVSRLCL